MSNTQERINKRREYLKKKGAAYTKASSVSLLAVLCAVLSIWLWLGLLVYISGDFGDFQYGHYAGVIMTELTIILLAVIGLALLCSVGAYRFARAAHQAHQEAQQLPYVPPVTATALPAEEVLVRGSEEPAQQQGKVLLRSTDGSGGTGEPELLRSSQGQE